MSTIERIDYYRELIENTDWIAFWTDFFDIQVRPGQAEYSVHCPFHQDDNPSLSVNIDTGLWCCHACGEKGNGIQFLAKIKNLSFKEAAREIQNRFYRGTALKKTRENNKKLQLIPPEVAEKFHAELLENKKALEFLKKKRGWTLETVKRFKLGYDNHRVMIPIFDEFGRLVNIRKYSPSGASPKFLHWDEGFGEARWFPIENLQHDEVVLFEGEPDTILANQLGINALTQTAGANTFKDKWAELFKGKKVWICYDNDETGRTGAQKAAAILARTANEVRIIELPVVGDKEDFTDWVLKYGGTKEAFEYLMAEAPVYEPPKEKTLEDEIQALPENINFEEHQTALKEIYRKIALKSPTAQEHYIELLKQRFKLSKKAIREEIVLQEMALKIEPAIPAPLDEPRDASLSLAQDMRDGVFHYLIYVSTNKAEFVPRLVTSEHKFEEIPVEAGDRLPQDTARWSLDVRTPYNLFAFLNNACRVDPKELFSELEAVFREYMWYRDDRYYKLIPLWVMETYVFMIFDEIGYLALVGTKRTGKTRLFEILEMLCFNATMSSSATDAYIFRIVERNRATLLVDEADALRKVPKESVNEKLEIIRSGYRRFGKVGRCEGENNRTVEFSTYSMKAIANVTGLEEALEDRVIHIDVERKPQEVQLAKLIKREFAPRAQVLRNKLYVFGLEHAKNIAELYKTYMPEGIEDREAEIWSGLLCIAKYIDQGLHDEMLALAIENKKRKELREGLESVEAQEIMALWQLVQENNFAVMEGKYKFWTVDGIRNTLKDQLGWEDFSHKRVTSDLQKLRIIDDSETFKRRFRLKVKSITEDGDVFIKCKQVMCLALDPERIRQAAKKYSVKLDEIDLEDEDRW